MTLFAADQFVAHAFGDYILQSDWMAQNKTKAFIPAAVHATVYSLPFLLFRPSFHAFVVILVTHFFIDRYRLARFVVSAKNTIGQPYGKFLDSPNLYSTPTGYPKDVPAWMAIWLLIIADNILHVTINALALKFL